MPVHPLTALRASLIVIATVLLALQLTGALDHLDNALGDRLITRHAASRSVPDTLVVVAIDQKSLEQLNEEFGAWPWPRAIYSELIEGLSAFAPQAIAFDIHFNEADHFRPDSDMALVETAKSHARNLYFPSLLLTDGNPTAFSRLPERFGAVKTADAQLHASAPLLLPLALDPINWRGGLVNFDQESDGVSRFTALWRDIAGWRLPGFAANIAQDTGAQLPEASRVRLNWYGHAPTTLSFAALIDDLGQHTPVLAETLRGKIVVIGATTAGLHDLRPTPLSTVTPGVEILTTAIANLHERDWLRDVSVRWPLIIVLLALMTVAFSRKLNALWIGIALAGISLALAVVSYGMLSMHRYLPMGAVLATSWIAYAILTAQSQWREHREREATVSLFRRFLDPRVVNELIASNALSMDKKPIAREISILFSDIRGFTALSETRSPEAVVELLNRYFSRQAGVVFKHGGTLDKFIGDAIMAFWNAPADLPNHAEQAVAAALDMADDIDAFRRDLLHSEPDLGDFDIGIGVHTGPAVVGFIGSQARLDYTAMGDSVNLASRIESTTKGVARVLVSDATRLACGTDSAFTFIPCGEFQVKGREQVVALYEPRKKSVAEMPIPSRTTGG